MDMDGREIRIQGRHRVLGLKDGGMITNYLLLNGLEGEFTRRLTSYYGVWRAD